MSESATVRSPSKRTRRNNDSGSAAAIGGFAANGSAVGGGSAASPDAAGNTTSEGTLSPLKAALVPTATLIESLPIASRPFLTPLAESVLREFAALFYAEEKANETKSDPNYVSSSAKKLNIVLQAMPEVQESQGFKTLRSDLTAELESFRARITRDYVLKANDMNVEAKRTRFHFAVCKWMRGLAAAFIAQAGVKNYSEDTAVIDLLALSQDQVLASLAIPLPTFLAAYKAANNLLGGIPKPTVDHNFDEEIDRVNGTPRLEANEDAVAIGNAEGNDDDDDDDDGNDNDEMIDAVNAVETAAIGGRAHIGRLILDALTKGTFDAIEKFHAQRKENDETKRIKAAFTSPRLNEAAQRIASVIANEPAAEMPVLRGLVQETAAKSTTAMERRIQSLEDQLKAVQGNKSPKKSKGDGKKKSPPGILKNKDTPAAPKKSIPKSVVSPNLGANGSDSAKGKGKKKKGGRKVSFDGKKAAKPTKSRK
jgi:hypothetical protein